MTETQKQVYMVIDEWWKRFGFGPSVDDVMKYTGYTSRGNVHRCMKILCEMGICKRTPKRARSIRPSYVRVRDI